LTAVYVYSTMTAATSIPLPVDPNSNNKLLEYNWVKTSSSFIV